MAWLRGTVVSESRPAPEGEQPGKTRTWWHPLLASVLRWQLGDHYRVEEEVNVGKKPLQIDLILLRQLGGELPDSTRRLLAGLVEYLNEYTLVEFKSPSDTLRAGDFQTFLAYALLYRAQSQPLLPVDRLNLVVIAPRLTRPYQKELEVCGLTTAAEGPGVWRCQGGTPGHAMWVLETEVLARGNHPLMAVFSPRLLDEPSAVSQELRREGCEQLVVYVTQQIQQFRVQGETFAMQHLESTSEMERIYDAFAASLTEEEIAKLLARLPLEKRLEGISPEERLEGLSPEERERLLELLQQEVKKRPRRGKKR
jgi:hypothetical protein